MRELAGKAAQTAGAVPDVDTLRQMIVGDVNEIVARLALALTVGSSGPLQADLRTFAGLAPEAAFAARLPESAIWVSVAASGETGPTRGPPAGVAQVDAVDAMAPGGLLRDALQTATDVAGGFRQAFDLLTPVFDPDTPHRRSSMGELIRWTPTFEHLAMRVSARTAMLSDALRQEVIDGLKGSDPDGQLKVREYAGLLRTSADLQLMVSDSGARPWLLEMVRSFVWQRWTPSWPLLRERLLAVTPAAAWSVTAIGPDIIQDYLDALVRADNLPLIFDALFGLIALAQGSPDDAAAIARDLSKRRAYVRTPVEAETELVGWLIGAAGRVIAAPDIFRRQLALATGFQGALVSSQLLPHVLAIARDLDPADPLQGLSAPLAFALAPVILSGDRADPYPETGPDDLSTNAMGEALRRAWGASASTRILN